ncbi:phosphotransferase family protein [Candidatus Leptofilum sp.]|uniref:phosphotransferase family protein n=1 Tax=Candidatus Leptofilum sp. TaxID=3241576 RepID=UPI003B59CF71
MRELLDYLATWPEDGRYQSHTIQKINGGANNILYKVCGTEGNLAVKFTLRDGRRRAWREFQALQAVQSHGLTTAPEPILLDETSYPQPVVVQSWLAGEVTAVPPQTDADWQKLVQHYVTLSQMTPENMGVALETAVVNFNGIQNGLLQIQQQRARIPPENQPAQLKELVTWVENLPQTLPLAQLALCRVDANSLNFIRRPGAWASVDWENSGWGDPAFEIADLATHPQYLDVPAERWDWVANLYAELCGEETAVLRIYTYTTLMLIWWVARLARALYEIPHGLDERLVPRDPDWHQQARQKLTHYTKSAFTAISK